MKKMLSVTAAILSVLVIGALGGCRHERHPGAELMVDYLAESLNLNEAQRQHIDRIKNELLDKGGALKGKHLVEAGELKRLLSADVLDEERLKEMMAEHRSRMNALADLAISRLAEFHRTLSPEQKAKLVGKMETFIKMHRGRSGFGSEG